MSTAAAFVPKYNWNCSWVMMEPFVLRRDDEETFPNENTVVGASGGITIRGSGTTSWHAPFRFALQLVEPPLVSRLYAHFPGFPQPELQRPFGIVSTHRHLVLFRVGMKKDKVPLVQEFFIYSAADPFSPLKQLPLCIKAEPDIYMTYSAEDQVFAHRRILTIRAMGLLCRGDPGEEEFAVAQLKLIKLREEHQREEGEDLTIYADIYILRSSSPASASGGLEWNSVRVPVDYYRGYNDDDVYQLDCWELDDVIPSDHGLCYIDYSRGILICDLFADPTPSVSFLRFPLDDFPPPEGYHVDARSRYYRGTSVTDAGNALKFINITRHDGLFEGELKPGAGFTIACHTLKLGTMEWNKDYTVTSQHLWSLNTPDRLPRTILMLPQANIDKPNLVYFLFTDYKYAMKKMWVVTIDMHTGKAESIYKYIDGREDKGTIHADLTIEKSSDLLPFLPCEFTRFLRYSRKRKGIE